MSLVCPSSWWQHAQATNRLTRALSHGHLPGYRSLYHVGSGPTQLFLGTVPRWGEGRSIHFCCFYTREAPWGRPWHRERHLWNTHTRCKYTHHTHTSLHTHKHINTLSASTYTTCTHTHTYPATPTHAHACTHYSQHINHTPHTHARAPLTKHAH